MRARLDWKHWDGCDTHKQPHRRLSHFGVDPTPMHIIFVGCSEVIVGGEPWLHFQLPLALHHNNYEVVTRKMQLDRRIVDARGLLGQIPEPDRNDGVTLDPRQGQKVGLI